MQSIDKDATSVQALRANLRSIFNPKALNMRIILEYEEENAASIMQHESVPLVELDSRLPAEVQDPSLETWLRSSEAFIDFNNMLDDANHKLAQS